MRTFFAIPVLALLLAGCNGSSVEANYESLQTQRLYLQEGGRLFQVQVGKDASGQDALTVKEVPEAK